MNILGRFGIVLLCSVATIQAPFASDGLLPKPIYSELPTYPERARMAHVAGTVKLWFEVDNTGGVVQSGIISGNSMLSGGALRTVKSWKFQPAAIKPGMRYETQFVYTLDVQSGSGEPKLTVSMTDLRKVEVSSELYVRTVE